MWMIRSWKEFFGFETVAKQRKFSRLCHEQTVVGGWVSELGRTYTGGKIKRVVATS